MGLGLGLGLQKRGGIAPFDPSSISGLTMDVNFRDSSSLVITSSPDIDSVTDAKAGFVFEQSTASKKPELVTVNGNQYARFTTDDNLDDVTDIPYPLRFNSTGLIMFGFIPRATSASSIWSAGDADNVRYWSAKIANVAGTMYLSFAMKYSGASTDQVYGDTPLIVDTPYVCTIISEGIGTPYTLRVNGVVQTNTAVTGTDNGRWFTNTLPAASSYIDTMSIGALPISGGHTVYAEGDIDRILYYANVTPSADDIAYLERGMAARIDATLA